MKGKQKVYYKIIKDIVDEIENGDYGKNNDIDESALIDDLNMVIEKMENTFGNYVYIDN